MEEILELYNNKLSCDHETENIIENRLIELMNIPEVLFKLPKLIEKSSESEKKIYTEFLMNSILKNWKSQVYDKYKKNFIENTLKLLGNINSEKEKGYLERIFIYISKSEDIIVWTCVFEEASVCIQNKEKLVAVMDFYTILYESKAYTNNFKKICDDKISDLLKIFLEKFQLEDYLFIRSFQKFLCTVFVGIYPNTDSMNLNFWNLFYDVFIQLINLDLYGKELDTMNYPLNDNCEDIILDLKCCILKLTYTYIEKIIVVFKIENNNDIEEVELVKNTEKTKKLVQLILKNLYKITKILEDGENDLFINQNLLDYSFLCLKILFSTLEESENNILYIDKSLNFLIFHFIILIFKFSKRDQYKMKNCQKNFLISFYDQSENIKTIAEKFFSKIIQIYHKTNSFECNQIIFRICDSVRIYNNDPNEINASLAYGFIQLFSIAIRYNEIIKYDNFVEKSLFPLINSKHLFLQYIVFDCLSYLKVNNLNEDIVSFIFDLFIKRIKNEEGYILVKAMSVSFLFFSYENASKKWEEKVAIMLEKAIKARELYGNFFKFPLKHYFDFLVKQKLDWQIVFNTIILENFVVFLRKLKKDLLTNINCKSSNITDKIYISKNVNLEDDFFMNYLIFIIISLSLIKATNIKSNITFIPNHVTLNKNLKISSSCFENLPGQYILSRDIRIKKFFKAVESNIIEANKIIIANNMDYLYEATFNIFGQCASTLKYLSDEFLQLFQKILKIATKEKIYFKIVGNIAENIIINVQSENQKKIKKILFEFINDLNSYGYSKTDEACDTIIHMIFYLLLYFRDDLDDNLDFIIRNIVYNASLKYKNFKYMIFYAETLMLCFIINFSKTLSIMLAINQLQDYLQYLYNLKDKFSRVFDKNLVLIFFGSFMINKKISDASISQNLKRHIPFYDSLQYKEIDFSIWIHKKTTNVNLIDFQNEKTFNISKLNEILLYQVNTYQKSLEDDKYLYKNQEVLDGGIKGDISSIFNPLLNFDAKKFYSKNFNEIGRYMASKMTEKEKNSLNQFIKQ